MKLSHKWWAVSKFPSFQRFGRSKAIYGISSSRFGSIGFNIRMLWNTRGWVHDKNGKCFRIASGQKVPHRRGLNGQFLFVAPAKLVSSLEPM